MDELEKQVAQKLKTIGFEQATMPKETYKQLLIIEKWFENAVQKRQDLLEEARKTKQSVLLTYLDSIISDATKIEAKAGDIKE